MSATKKKPAAKAPAGAPAPGRRRPDLDWDAVERDYRSDRHTLRELADKYGCSHVTIAQRAKRHGWSRDLTSAVKQATRAKLIEEAVSTAVSSKANDAQQETTATVLAAAEVNKQVILRHRGDLRRAREVALDLLEEVSAARLLAEEKELLAEILAGSSATPTDEAKARETVRKALSLNSRTSAFKAFTDAITKLMDGERRAFGLDDEDEDKGPKDPAEVFKTFFAGLHQNARLKTVRKTPTPNPMDKGE